MDWKLQRHPSFGGVPGPVVACVLDGVGIGARDESDAVWLARKPHLDWLERNALVTSLAAHGVAVGMPSDADMGNSEVGHNALGAGRIFDQSKAESGVRSRSGCADPGSRSTSSGSSRTATSTVTSTTCSR
jgi:2,3-bisphosphoglycerate-independent phosphoglycerate mutase